jgi:hypothetical protein
MLARLTICLLKWALAFKNSTVKKLLILLFLAGPLGVFFQACSPCNCPPVESYYKIGKMFFTAYKVVKKPTEELIPLPANGIVKADSLALNVAFTRAYYSKQQPSFHIGLINSALACKCISDGYKGTTEKILNISVVTLKDFNTRLTAGTDISNITLINDQLVNNFIQNWNNNRGTTGIFTVVSFSEAMAVETQHQLEFRITTSMGTFAASTQVFTVIP